MSYYEIMKKLTLWTTAIVSALFVIVVCIDGQKWELLGGYAAIVAVWSVLGCYWLNRKVFLRDLKLLNNCSSPMKCEWTGTFIFLGLVALGIIAVVIAAMFFIVSQEMKYI